MLFADNGPPPTAPQRHLGRRKRPQEVRLPPWPEGEAPHGPLVWLDCARTRGHIRAIRAGSCYASLYPKTAILSAVMARPHQLSGKRTPSPRARCGCNVGRRQFLRGCRPPQPAGARGRSASRCSSTIMARRRGGAAAAVPARISTTRAGSPTGWASRTTCWTTRSASGPPSCGRSPRAMSRARPRSRAWRATSASSSTICSRPPGSSVPTCSRRATTSRSARARTARSSIARAMRSAIRATSCSPPRRPSWPR